MAIAASQKWGHGIPPRPKRLLCLLAAGLCLLPLPAAHAGKLSGEVKYADGSPAWFGISVRDKDNRPQYPPYHIPLFKDGIDWSAWFGFGSYEITLSPGDYTVALQPLEGFAQETQSVHIRGFNPARADFTVRPDAAAAAPPPTRLRIRIQEDGKPQAARLSVTAISRETSRTIALAPVGVPSRVWRLAHHYFHAWDGCEIVIPPDAIPPIRVHAVRGTEYEFFNREITPKPGEVTDLTIDMKRWIDLAGEGWYSGDVHTHILGAASGPPGSDRRLKKELRESEWFAEYAFRLMQAEDMRVGSWLLCPGDPNMNRGTYSQGPYRIKFDQESRNSTYGHMHALLLERAVEQFNTGRFFNKDLGDYPSNLPLINDLHDAGAVVGYAHPMAGGNPSIFTEVPWLREAKGINNTAICRGLPSDAVLGPVELLEIYSWSSQEDWSEGLWYHLLNCGFSIMPAAGTDAFNGGHFQSGPPGGLRCYVKLPGEQKDITYRDWVLALAQGRSFMTSGPALELTVNGKDPGETIALGVDGGSLKAAVRLRSNLAVDTVEVLLGGKVVKTLEVGDKWSDFRGECEIEARNSSYITSRARSKTPNPDLLEEEVRALTGPVMVNVGGQKRRSAESAQYFIRWIDEFRNVLDQEGQFATEAERAEVYAELEKALEFYREMAGEQKAMAARDHER